jgi:CPA1 family monovalent cation:H+ antiporter
MVYTAVVVVFSLLVAVVALASVATRLRLPYPILLVLGGLALGFVPGLPTITLDPAMVLFLFLPPLIYSSAWLTPWRDFRADLGPILRLAIGLVLVTTALVAVVAHTVFGMGWAVAFVLGALVSPTDAVAAAATVQRLGVSRRVTTILEGESMVNDATGLVNYRFAVAAVVGGVFSLWQASLQFVLVSAGGILIGLLVAFPVAWIHRRLDDAPREITLTLLTPFAAYLLADALGVSGVLAVLAAGLSLSRQSSTFFSPNTRLNADSVWSVLIFLLNGLVFIMLGLQLHSLLSGATRQTTISLLGAAVVITLVVVIVRLVGVLVVSSVSRLLASYSLIAYRWLGWRNVFLVGWCGMRGAVSLAAALALPVSLTDGRPFPYRSQLILITFGVILFTLVGQGVILVPLIRMFGMQSVGSDGQELFKAQRALTLAALAYVEEVAARESMPEVVVTDRRAHLEQKLRGLEVAVSEDVDPAGRADPWTAARHLRREVVDAERTALLELWDRGEISATVLRQLERELDLEQQQLSG